MKSLISKWQLRWFVVLWVFAGFMAGFGMGMWKVGGGDIVLVGIWTFWIAIVIYLVVAGTLGRGYLRLIRELR